MMHHKYAWGKITCTCWHSVEHHGNERVCFLCQCKKVKKRMYIRLYSIFDGMYHTMMPMNVDGMWKIIPDGTYPSRNRNLQNWKIYKGKNDRIYKINIPYGPSLSLGETLVMNEIYDFILEFDKVGRPIVYVLMVKKPYMHY